VTAAAGQDGERSLFARAHASVDVLYREIAKFGAVGAIAFVVDFGVFNLMRTGIIGGEHGLAEKPLTAKTISVLAATIVAWLGNRYWTFRHRRRASARREFVLFGVMNIGGLIISLACLGFSHYLLGLTSTLADNIAGNVIGLGLGTLFRFWAYRQLVFTTADEQQFLLGDEDQPEAPDQQRTGDAGSAPVERRTGLEILDPRLTLDLREHARPNLEPVSEPASAQRRQA
jgi:putative flippase GtrA